MAKATLTRMVRKFNRELVQKGGQFFEEIYRKVTPQPAQPREEMPCGLCGKPMMVSAGQLAYFHAKCRQLSRNRLRREAKRKM